MSQYRLSTYLNDHLAGAVMALAMLEDVASRYRDYESLARSLTVEVAADREQLERIMEKARVRTGIGAQVLGLDDAKGSTRKNESG